MRRQQLSYQQLVHDIAEMHKALHPPLYYVTREATERGKMYYAKETKFTPECVICHPSDLEKIRGGISRPLVHLREWKGKQIEACIVPTSDQEPITATLHDGGGGV